MRKVNGENMTIAELKKSYFGYNENIDFYQIVEIVECNRLRYTYTEKQDAIIRYPLDIEDGRLADYILVSDSGLINIYDFITNYWGLEDYELEDFTFYFLL